MGSSKDYSSSNNYIQYSGSIFGRLVSWTPDYSEPNVVIIYRGGGGNSDSTCRHRESSSCLATRTYVSRFRV